LSDVLFAIVFASLGVAAGRAPVGLPAWMVAAYLAVLFILIHGVAMAIGALAGGVAAP
jgi:hypothetical protein